ncbi:MAG: Gfo/Idh/MocA family oxidoreductase [Fimbriimonas sp.]|nr:Gfo/Idh/MocA family oxidoreductase [Fimbriimonas sp.]
MADKIRIGFVGAGGIARAHVDAFSKVTDAEIAAVTDVSKDAATALAEKTGAAVFDSARSLARDAGVDAIFILLPPFAHGEAERAALESGLPFFCEKPVGLDPGFLQEVAAEVEAKGLLTSVGYMNRYRSSVNRAKQILEADPAIMAFGGWWGGSPGSHPWWTDKSKSGGQFHEQATHTVDIVRYLFGEAVEVYAAAANGFNKDIPGYTMDDAATVTVRFANDGVANLMCSASSNAGGSLFLDVHSLNHNFHFTEWEHHVAIKSKGADPEVIHGEAGIFSIEDAAFIEAVRTGDRSGIRSTYGDGVKTSLVSLAANRSLETGKPVSL